MESYNGRISLVHITPESTDQSQFLMSLQVGQRAVLVWAAITKYHRLGGSNKRHLFFMVLKAEKFRVKGPADI